MDAEKLRASLSKGSVARLLPVVADGKKEERATSVVLAAFTVVPDFAHAVLSEAGAPISKTSKIQCLTEVAFKGAADKNSRPDGLIIVSTGKRVWSALVESKVARSKFDASQVEDYLSLAKEHGVDAVLTISNQFASLPTHHPVQVNKQKLRNTGLFHFSWLSIISKALLLIDGKAIADREQAYILRELVRYLEHDGSGVKCAMKMSAGWKQVCELVHQGAHLNRSSEDVQGAVSSWHQLQRYLAIQLTLAVSKPVSVSLSRKHSSDPAARLQDDINELVSRSVLESTLLVPNAAGKITLRADFLRKTLDLSIRVDAPGDTKRQTAAINWLVRQLRNCKPTDTIVRANWPRRIATTACSTSDLMEDIAPLLPENVKDLATSFDIVAIEDMGGKFKSVNAFVDLSESGLVTFYRNICQNLTRWVPKAPKVKKSAEGQAPVSEDEAAAQALSEALGLKSEGHFDQPSEESQESSVVVPFNLWR